METEREWAEGREGKGGKNLPLHHWFVTYWPRASARHRSSGLGLILEDKILTSGSSIWPQSISLIHSTTAKQIEIVEAVY